MEATTYCRTCNSSESLAAVLVSSHIFPPADGRVLKNKEIIKVIFPKAKSETRKTQLPEGLVWFGCSLLGRSVNL